MFSAYVVVPDPPPALTAYFSRSLKPGVVFLVSRTFAFVPEISLTHLLVVVATQLCRQSLQHR